jgi:hypothetical protein
MQDEPPDKKFRDLAKRIYVYVTQETSDGTSYEKALRMSSPPLLDGFHFLSGSGLGTGLSCTIYLAFTHLLRTRKRRKSTSRCYGRTSASSSTPNGVFEPTVKSILAAISSTTRDSKQHDKILNRS